MKDEIRGITFLWALQPVHPSRQPTWHGQNCLGVLTQRLGAVSPSLALELDSSHRLNRQMHDHYGCHPQRHHQTQNSNHELQYTWLSQSSDYAEDLMNTMRFRPIPEDIRDDTVSVCHSFWSPPSSSPSLTLGNLHSLIASIAPTRWRKLCEERTRRINLAAVALWMNLGGIWLGPSTAYLKLVYSACPANIMRIWSMNKRDKWKVVPLLSSLGVCILMFRGVAEGFMKSALVGNLPCSSTCSSIFGLLISASVWVMKDQMNSENNKVLIKLGAACNNWMEPDTK